MGATFTTTGEWQGVLKGGYQLADKVAELAAPDTGKIWRRKHYISDRYRNGQGLLSWASSAGDRVYGDDLIVTNGPDNMDGLIGGAPDHIITSNDLTPDPPGSGIWKETQVAEGFGEWEQWEIAI